MVVEYIKLFLLRKFIGLFLVFTLSSCGWLYGEKGLVKSNEFTYINSHQGHDLKIPAGLKSPKFMDEYPVPPIPKSAQQKVFGKDLDITAPILILAVDPSSGVYSRDVRKEPIVWFRLNEIKVWQALLDYLQKEKIQVSKKDLDKGIIETGWIIKETDSFWNNWFGDKETKAVRARYQFKVQKSPKGKLTLLSVIPLDSDYKNYESEQWHQNLKKRQDSITFMNGFLATWAEQRGIAARAKILAANKGIKLTLGKDNNDKVAFVADANFERVWVRLAIVAKYMGIVIDDKDQSQGIYYVTWNGGPDSGFLDALKFWKNDTGVDLPLAKGEYQFNLNTMGDKTAITINKKESNFLSDKKMGQLFDYFAEGFSKNEKTISKRRK